MSWRRCRSQLNRKKKKAKKMDYYEKENQLRGLPPLAVVKDRELGWTTLRGKLRPFHFSCEVEDYVLPNGDAVCDNIQCTAFYELMSSVPVVHIVDVKYGDLKETKEFGELLSVAYEKITQKLDIC